MGSGLLSTNIILYGISLEVILYTIAEIPKAIMKSNQRYIGNINAHSIHTRPIK